LRQQVGRGAEAQGQHDVAQVEPVQAGQRQRPLRVEFRRQRGEFGPAPVQLFQVGPGEGVLFHGNVMQAPAGSGRRSAPCLPGGEEIEAEAEAGFEDDEAPRILPARRQLVAGEEDMARLFEAALAGMVDVVVARRERGAVPGERKFGGDDRGHYSRRICGNRITSRIEAELVSSITSRSMPMPQPPVGGRPYSSARM
jgi:hypothetical protein